MDFLINFAGKISHQRQLNAIKNAFISAVPLTLAASFAILINNVIFSNQIPYMLGDANFWPPVVIDATTNLSFIFSSMTYGSLEILSLVIIIALSYTLAKESNVKNPIINTMLVFGCFFVLFPKGQLVEAIFPHQWAEGFDAANKAHITLSGLYGATNLFTAIIVGLFFSEFLIYLQKQDRLRIKMHEQVPPEVSNAFASLLPGIIVLFFSGFIAFLFMIIQPFGYTNLSAFVSGLFQAPFLALAKTNIGGWGIITIYVFFQNLFWIFGIHGPNVLMGFSQPTLGVMQSENTQLFAQTKDAFDSALAIFPAGFLDAYVNLGGSGTTIGFLLATLFVSKREDYQAIAKLSVAPGIFNINEPVIFGIPIVLNPILAIPFVLSPLVMIIIPGLLTQFGVLPKIVLSVPWITPPILGAFLATGLNWLAPIVVIINLIICTLIYIPFVRISSKAAMKDAQTDI